jgi:hypothetical protein
MLQHNKKERSMSHQRKEKKADYITEGSVVILGFLSMVCNFESVFSWANLGNADEDADENNFTSVAFLCGIAMAAFALGNIFTRYHMNKHYQEDQPSKSEQKYDLENSNDGQQEVFIYERSSFAESIDPTPSKSTLISHKTTAQNSEDIETTKIEVSHSRLFCSVTPFEFAALSLSLITLTFDKTGGISLGATRILEDVFDVNTEEFPNQLYILLVSTLLGLCGSLADARTNRTILSAKHQQPHSNSTSQREHKETTELVTSKKTHGGDWLTTFSTGCEAISNLINNYQWGAQLVQLFTSEDKAAIGAGIIMAIFAVGSMYAHQKFNGHHEHGHSHSHGYNSLSHSEHHHHSHGALTRVQKVSLRSDYITHYCEAASPMYEFANKFADKHLGYKKLSTPVKAGLFGATTIFGMFAAAAEYRNCKNVFVLSNEESDTTLTNSH